MSEQIREFEEYFAVEFRAVRDTMEQSEALEPGSAEAASIFDWWQEQLVTLQELVSGASAFLPTQLRQSFGKKLDDSAARLKQERDRLTPKKKFGFKNRKKVVATPVATPVAEEAAGAKDEAAGGAVPTGGGVAHSQKMTDSFQAPAGCQGFRGQSGATLIRPAGEGLAHASTLMSCS